MACVFARFARREDLFFSLGNVAGRQLRRNERHTMFGECRCDISSVNFHGELNISVLAYLLTRSRARDAIVPLAPGKTTFRVKQA